MLVALVVSVIEADKFHARISVLFEYGLMVGLYDDESAFSDVRAGELCLELESLILAQNERWRQA